MLKRRRFVSPATARDRPFAAGVRALSFCSVSVPPPAAFRLPSINDEFAGGPRPCAALQRDAEGGFIDCLAARRLFTGPTGMHGLALALISFALLAELLDGLLRRIGRAHTRTRGVPLYLEPCRPFARERGMAGIKA